MPEPIIWQAMAAFKTLLDGVTIANGAFYDTTTVYRDPRPLEGSSQLKHLNLILYANNTPRDSEAEPHLHAAWVQRFSVDCIIEAIDSELTSTPNDQILFRIWSDVTKRIQTDPNLGGLVTDIITAEPELFDIDGEAMNGITAHFDVHYRTLVDNPYSQ